MAVNKDFTFPTKNSGLALGNDDYTWLEQFHWPELTISYLETQTGINLATKKAGNLVSAQKELTKVAKLSKVFLMEMLPKEGQYEVEYRVAKDQDLLYEVLEYQVQIFEAGFVDGGWLSMYETTDQYGIKSSIGKAAEDFLFMSDLRIWKYKDRTDPTLFRDGTY